VRTEGVSSGCTGTAATSDAAAAEEEEKEEERGEMAPGVAGAARATGLSDGLA
jgi:hypothetical protein